MAAGVPVVAYGAGGALETVVDGVTGVFFAEQTEAALLDAVERAERTRFDLVALVANAVRFSRERFRREFEAVVSE